MKTSKNILIFVAVLAVATPVLSQKTTVDTVVLVSQQETPPALLKNSIYLTGGLLMGFTISGNFERILWQNPDQSLRALTVRVGVGKSWMESWFLVGSTKYELRTYTGMLGFLVGRRGSNFDFGMGATLFDGTTSTKSIFSSTEREGQYQEVNLAMNLGYRYQKPGDNFIFRCGLGWPDGLYVSLGISF